LPPPESPPTQQQRAAVEDPDASCERRGDQADGQDRDPDLARRKAHVGHARARGEAQALGLGAGVADHERRGHGGGSEDGPEVEPAGQAPPGDAHVDDALAPPVEHRVHERPQPADPARRPRERAVEQVEHAAEDHQQPGGEPPLGPGRDRGDAGDAEAIRVGHSATKPSRALSPSATGVIQPAHPGPGLRGDEREPLTGRSRARVARARRPNAQDSAGDRRTGEASGSIVWTGSRPWRWAVTSPTCGSCPGATRRAGCEEPRHARSARSRSPGRRRAPHDAQAVSRRRASMWNSRSSRRSSAGPARDAIVERNRTGGGGHVGRCRPVARGGLAVGNITAFFINGR